MVHQCFSAASSCLDQGLGLKLGLRGVLDGAVVLRPVERGPMFFLSMVGPPF